jgi:hypothetical protein
MNDDGDGETWMHGEGAAQVHGVAWYGEGAAHGSADKPRVWGTRRRRRLGERDGRGGIGVLAWEEREIDKGCSRANGAAGSGSWGGRGRVGMFLAAAVLPRAKVRLGKARDAHWAGWGRSLVAGLSGKRARWMGRGSWAIGERRARGGGARGPWRETMALGRAAERAGAEGASRWAARARQVE